MRVNPIDIEERRRKLVEEVKKKVAIGIALISVVFFLIKIVFL